MIAGGTQRLPRLVGVQKAKYMILTAKKMGGREALEYGVVDFVDGVNSEKLASANVVEEFPEFFSEEDKAKPEGSVAFRMGLQLAKEILPQVTNLMDSSMSESVLFASEV